MTTAEIESYVDAAAIANGLHLTAAQREQVIMYFTRTAQLAEPLLALELPADVEIAAVFRA